MKPLARSRHSLPSLVAVSLLAAALLPAAWGSAPPVLAAQNADQAPAAAAPVLEMNRGLTVPPVSRYGRNALPVDLIQSAIVAGVWDAPREGDPIVVPDGPTHRWEAIAAEPAGVFRHPSLRGGYLNVSVESDREQVKILEAQGHATVHVNGRPLPGDMYGHGWLRLPVHLAKGTNHFLFHVARGELHTRLVDSAKPLAVSLHDNTMADLIAGEPGPFWCAVPVINAGTEDATELVIVTQGDALETMETPLGRIMALAARKVGFRVAAPTALDPETREVQVRLQLVRQHDGARELLDETTFTLPIRRSDELHRRTFISRIDGSVQYYAVQPAKPEANDGVVPALFLTLHGASVEASGQAAVYAQKSWGHVVAPTNRRPFGFDWEDWGRLDAIEVLQLAQQQYGTDPARTYLTGHSMGGHGTWHLGVTFPDRFAAIGPSAGWISFWTYGNARRYEEGSPLEQMFARANSPSDTLALLPNLAARGIYVLHGDRDDNVPVQQARTMRQNLAQFHPNFVYREQPGAGHWWGNACCDWSPMFAFFAHHRLAQPAEVRRVQFIAASPGVSARMHWATVVAQQESMKPSVIEIDFDPDRRRFSGKTQNVLRLALDVTHVERAADRPQVFAVELDNTTLADLPWPADGTLWLERIETRWQPIATPPPSDKNPQRYGPLREAFNQRVLFVYGTEGTEEENTWARDKAGYDALTFGYRGNGSIDVLPDRDFRPADHPDRGVILYGNATTNSAWDALLPGSPVHARRGAVRVGDRTLEGEDLAVLFVRPRPDSPTALVGVIGGSGAQGMRATTHLPYFVSGVGYPDLMVTRSDLWTRGAEAVRCAGYFGVDWSTERGQIVWSE